VNLTVDCVLTTELSRLKSDSALAHLLAKGKVSLIEQPLEDLICEQFSLEGKGEYPIAATSALADGLKVGESYWLRADPVHLVLQRDCFSLAEPVPLMVNDEHAASMMATLNQHFNQDGSSFYIGKSGTWYLCCDKPVQIETTLASIAIDKNVHHFMPRGTDAPKFKALLNEVQMLLHKHPANEARENLGEVAVNSVWLSGCGAMPQTQSKSVNKDISLVLANDVFHQGLAKWAGVTYQELPVSLDAVLSNHAQQVRLQLSSSNKLDEVWFLALWSALKYNKKIKQLNLNLGFYEKCLIVKLKPLDCYKFWRSVKPVVHYLT
jgi:hypothetical protein